MMPNSTKIRLSVEIELDRLKDPFPERDIEWRVSRSGITNGKPWAFVLAYLTARAVMNRLDWVCGPENWTAQYTITPHGVICKLGIRVNNEWIYKEDGAEQTEVEAFKGGLSGALKRAASAWGIGRYLYDLEELFADFVERGTPGAHYSKIKDQEFFWLPPKLPDWALPVPAQPEANPANPKDGESKPNINERLGIKDKADARAALNARILKAHRAMPNPARAKEILAEKFSGLETRQLSVEQLSEFAGLLEQELPPEKPSSETLPEHHLDEFMIIVGKEYKGKTFKQMLDQIGVDEFEGYFKATHDFFLRQIKEKKLSRISKPWQETFQKAEEYLYGEGGKKARPKQTQRADYDDSGL